MQNRRKKLIIVIISLLVLAIVCLASIFGLMASRANTKKIYKGISIGSVDVGGMSKSKAIQLLKDKYDNENINVKLKCENVEFNIYGSAFELEPDIESSVNKAASYGKKGSVLDKISNMRKIEKKGVSLELSLKCDYDALQYAINEKLADKIVDVVPYSVEIGEDELIVRNGKAGKGVSAEDVLSLISKAIVEDTLDEIIEISIKERLPEPIDADEFIKEYNREAKDAYVEDKDGEIIIIPDVIGIKTDKAETKRILEKNKNSDKEYSIPARITMPGVSYEELEDEYLDTLIGTYSSDYSTSSANRKTNIHLASDKINGVTLNPGEEFSFNAIVGPRTEATGYKVAHVYSGNKVADGIGGGICQVSSTLYNAVVLADLEIVSRRNHSLPVSYVPLGRDATVSYGSIDFVFRNDKATPVKLEVIHDGSKLTVNVYGRKKYKKDISIETHIVGTDKYTTEVIKDDTMYEGERKVEEVGSNGTRTEAYKIVKENGTIMSKTLLCKSAYVPTKEVVRVGTKKREASDKEPPVDNDSINDNNEKPDTPTSEETEKPADVPYPEAPVGDDGYGV